MLYHKGFSKDSRNLWHTKFLSPFMTQLTCEEYQTDRTFWEFKVCVRFEGGGFSLFSAFNQSVARSTHTHQHKRKSKHSRVISFLCFGFCFYLLFTLATPLRDVLSFCVVLLPPKAVVLTLLVFLHPYPAHRVYATPLLGPLRTLFSIYFPCFLLILSESVSDRAFVEIHSLKAGEIFVSRASKETPEHCHQRKGQTKMYQ